jgi:hypothetical protein
MTSASYYREQARLLLEWAQSRKAADHPEMANWLASRAQHYFVLANAAEITCPAAEDRLGAAISAVSERQMSLPKKEDE